MKKTNENLVILITLFAISIVIANVTGARTITTGLHIGPIELALSGGAITYAVTFLCTDIIGEIWGKATAQRVVKYGFIGQIFATACIMITGVFPATDAVMDNAYQTLLGQNWIFVIGSLSAYLVSQSWDVAVFHAIRDRYIAKHGSTKGGRWLWNNGSTITSQIWDTVIYAVISFGFGLGWVHTHEGRMQLIGIIIGQYLLKAENMRDMDMTEGRRFLRDAVLEHFGVPREIMGITESSNRATSEAAQYIYAQNVIMPRLNRREEAINTQILPFYGNDLVWHFDDVVPRSQEFDKAKGIDGWNAGLLTKDEARELLGMEPCKTGGDCFKITISDMFIGSNDDPAEVTTDLMQESTDEFEVTDDEDTGGMLSMSDRREHEEKSRVQNIGNLLAAAQKAQRAKFEVATMKFFRQQQKRLSGSLSGTEKADWSVWDVLMPYITENHVEDSAAWSALGEQEQKNLVEQFIGGLVNWPSEETAMEEIFKPLWKQTYDEGTRIAKQAYNIRGVDRPELLSQAKLHGGKRVRRVTQTTKENISRIVANGIEAGIGREKMADEILQEYEIQTRSRARLIADQETVMTLETGHYDMMQKSGATTKTWHHRPQKNPRDGSDGGPNHVKMDGETVPIDARFSNGLRYPCDPEGPARETIKCRCYVTYNR